jgi:hypothetical protein
LDVPVPSRPPVRLDIDDTEEMHALLVRRHRGHGSVVIDAPRWLRAEWPWTDKPFALGYRADDGRLTHFLAGSAKDAHGPYEIDWLAYEEPRQLLELLGLLRSLGDQVNRVELNGEPADVQLQDLVREPIRQRRLARLAGGSGALHDAVAGQQDRILDLVACVDAVRLRTPSLDLGLRLRDPLAARGSDASIDGEHTLRLGSRSSVEEGIASGLPVLDASVGAFTRMWLGSRPASSLALTDDLHAPVDLLDALDEAFRLPPPFTGWPF